MEDPAINLFEAESLESEAKPASGYPAFEAYPTEEIGGLRFCVWPSAPRQVCFAPTARFAMMALAGEAVLLGGSLAFVQFIFVHPDLGGVILRIVALATMVVIYGGAFAGLLLMRRTKVTDAEARPLEVPNNAVPVRVSTRAQDTSLGGAVGWMWIDRSWMCFRGTNFGFRLQASDFTSKVNPQLMTGALRLALPKGFPTTAVWISRRLLKGDRFEKWTFKEQLGDDLEVWREAAQTKEPRLYPPMRSHTRAVRVVRSLVGWTAIGLGMGAILAGFFAQLPEGVAPKANPITASVAFGFLIPMIFGLSALSSELTRRSRDSELRKAAKRNARQ